MISGRCLCGMVVFRLTQKPSHFYRCHCSLCRRQTGTGHNLATIVNADHFRWLAGETFIASWRRPQGYRNDFCRNCGSTVPNDLRDRPLIWLPIGLLDDDLDLHCAGDYCLDDALSWSGHPVENRHQQAPDSLDALLHALHVTP
ncbi:GFA family protein [Pantoea stewartii]|uniref:GFA family protein n=1 Tax=Pantoea stewartii TaxID=66269 RepID=UPI0021D48C85|nr:GFA family protein [Pantoea stewartii]MCU7367757.1 GFA family protein [Pantoea stewartii]